MTQNNIYLDNAAATRTAPEVVDAMLPYFTDIYAVASSQFSHSPGIQAREGLDRAREIIATRIHAKPEEIIFTSGGTESNNLALKGTAWASRGKKNHIICSRIENRSVIDSCKWLEKEGFDVTYLDVDEEGFIDLDRLKKSLTGQTFLVSVQHGNQEVGTVQPVEAIAGLCRERGILYHMDAILSFTYLDIDVQRIPFDLISISANRIHGPKGIGALYIRDGVPIQKMMHGGFHEFDHRAGTENVAGAVGFGKAVELSDERSTRKIRSMQSDLIKGLTGSIEGVRINGPSDLHKRLPQNVNVSFDLVEGESVVLHLDMKGISVITGSACFSRSLEPSYVMMVMGFTHERAHGSIRYTLSRYNDNHEMGTVVDSCREVVDNLRKISPLKKKE